MPIETTHTSPNELGHQIDVLDPRNGRKISEVPVTSPEQLNLMLDQSTVVQSEWAVRTLKERVQVFFQLRNLLASNAEELAQIICSENGKTHGEGMAEVNKAMELCEFACSLPQIIHDEVQEVSRGVECRTSRQPRGIVACITPFNFPLMVPMWSLPNALALGNAVFLKPSEQTPLTAVRLQSLMHEAGLPRGLLQIVQGGKDLVEKLCDCPSIDALSFVGSTKIAALVYRRATSNLKNCIALGGAKNHLIVLPDADEEVTAANIAAAMSGCAGQRCMAASAMVAVGNVDHIVHKIVQEAEKITPGAEIGAVISAEAKARIERYITDAVRSGAQLLLDGRNPEVANGEGGFYVGPTVLDHVRPDMKIAQEEVFGPVLAIMRSPDVDQAIAIENASNYGNASSVFTQNGAWANYVADRVSVGMVGVNIGVPVPREPFSFGGWNESKFGTCDITGKSSIHFWTRLKKRTTKWNASDWQDWTS
ncbi:MAG: CoA-acylating methylmalonate-semialdehyde dehydrogenase [Saprospiraceae bacterium]|nr:CoA-acylating methylmalonate-semialdehyde dehydrogenase [Saprospiraceae bacterium]